MPNARYHHKEIKTAIRKQELADFFTASRYSFSPYRACEHGCLYCDGRAEKYYVEGEFDRDIIIRKNIPGLLKKELPKLRERAFLCIGSGVSDVYQPIEREMGIMRQCAEILVNHNLPVVVMTKSSLILRDLDLWSAINRQGKFLLMISLTTTNDALRETFEPGASPVAERLDTIRQFKAAGCSVGVLAMPFLPYITETDSNMQALALAVKKSGADFCMPGGLTLRPGVQKEFFTKFLKCNFPQYTRQYESIYSRNLQSGSPAHDWRKKVTPYYQQLFATTTLPPVIPHHVFRDHVPRYEEVYLLLSLLKIAYEYQSVDTRRLQQALQHYKTWITAERRPIARSRKRSLSEVDDLLVDRCNNGSIGAIIKNEKLGEFVKRVVIDRAVFDGVLMQLC